MYILDIVDKNNTKLELIKARAQVDIDKITTLFKDKNELITSLGLDYHLYKIVIEDTRNNKNLDFTSSKYKNLIYLYKNIDNEKQLIKKVLEKDDNTLFNYFLDELLNLDDKNLNDYEKDKYKKLLNIIDYFEVEEQKIDVDNKKIEKLIQDYIMGNYNYNKNLYCFIKDCGIDYEPVNKIDINKDEYIKKMKEKIDIYKNSDNTFNSEKLEKLNLSNKKIDEDEENVYSNFHKELYDDDDIDEKMSELDMFMDYYNIDENRKREMIKKINRD